ncbi:sensor domain-containing diguanylate cyclase [Halodesulfovibrio sp.]|jgi:diguanylate cyclase (GGDEF)-like protein|uniref:sensor domain-containing diguanylate cyclase n=1 Tax=Halodesulfovibrio sp. TaxID=1912772 RepID=UPI0025D4E0CE|nr:sensor domain-containing diguanylate cyclase [Halodesulfovibrio sp.]MCT4536315.1 sensor domain-containing diguanylate cyclase [Halodesulfovibrio sp.]
MQKNSKINIISTALLCLSMTLITIGLVEVIIRSDAEHEKALIRDTLLNTGALIGQEVQRNISYGIVLTESLDVLIKSNNYEIDDFEKWAEQLFTMNSRVDSIQLAPSGVVSKIHPLRGNEGAIGHDLLHDARRANGALKTVHSRKVTFIGPVKLIQNDKYAVIARKPIFKIVDGNEQFWGFTIAVLSVDRILPPRVRKLEGQGLYIKLEGANPDAEIAPVLFSSAKWRAENAVEMEIGVPNGTWKLLLGHDPIKNKYYDMARIFTIFLAFSFSCVVFVQQCRMNTKQGKITFLNKKLTELSLKDELTSIGNRRAAMKALDYHISQAKEVEEEFSTLMLDLDFFKQVNDQYGHPAGDHLLQHVANCVQSTVRRNDSVFRIGGDEFLVLFPQTDISGGVAAARKLHAVIEKTPCVYEDVTLPVSVSIGLVEYSDDSIKSLLHRVDVKLYEAKKAGRNAIRY